MAEESAPTGEQTCILVDYTLHTYDGPIELPSACLNWKMDRGDWIVIDATELGDGVFRSGFD